MGGKKALRDEVVSRFPVGFERYIEVFGGAAWVLFHKSPSHFEVYNDFDGELVNLFRVVREKPRELIDALRLVLNARADFELARDTLKSGNVTDEVRSAALFFQLVKQSYRTRKGLCAPLSFTPSPRSSFSIPAFTDPLTRSRPLPRLDLVPGGAIW